MKTSEVKRDILLGGSIRLSIHGCSFTYERPRPNALLVTITGHDQGHFGSSTVDEVLLAISREGVMELFVDASRATGVAVAVSDEWTRFFSQNRDNLRRVHVLVGSEYVYLTVSIAQHLSRTGNLIKIHSDPAGFDEALKRGTGGFRAQ